MTYTDFLAIFPEFSNATTYPTARITFWLGYSANMADSTRWGALYNQGVALLTAHMLAIDSQNQLTQGVVNGIQTAKAVDSVSVSMDVNSITIAAAGLYNKTTYGIQYYQLAQMMGAGGLQFAC